MSNRIKTTINYIVLLVFFTTHTVAQDNMPVVTGAEQTNLYLPLIAGKKVAVVTNQTGIIGNTHIVDSLLKLKIDVKKIFSPEHGFRGDADAGEHLKSSKDKRTGLPIVSLYGSHNKPTPADLSDVDIVLFDIQDVGVRFYTYISTLHYVMEACAENNKPLIILDRPNPNGFYVDGPVLEEKHRSFVGLHPVPIVYGLTIAEYGLMINNEGWLKGAVRCDLKIIQLKNYTHHTVYDLPVKPSPNLPNLTAIYLYPSLALFEGTIMSVGRGTDFPFQVVGHPTLINGSFTFTPQSKKGASEPMYMGKECKGFDLRKFDKEVFVKNGRISLEWLIKTYSASPERDKYFNNYFNSLAGNSTLKQQIIKGMSEEEIRKTWEPALSEFKLKRKQYLLYEDFE